MPEAAPQSPARTRKLFRYSLYAIGVLALSLVAAAAYLVATFDPNDYRERIVQLVHERTGRTLEMRDRIALTFWPDVGIRLGAVSLSERDSSQPFATVAQARVKLELEPLLKREFIASELVIEGANVAITRYEDGRLNIDDLLAGGGETPRFDIARLAVSRSAIVLSDVAQRRHYEVSNITLETGRVSPRSNASVKLAFDMRDAAESLQVRAKLAGRLTLDMEARRYAMAVTSLEVAGRLGAVTDATLRARGGVAADLNASSIDLGGVELALEGLHEKTERISLSAAAAEVNLVDGEARGRDVRVSLVAKGPAGLTDVKIVLPLVTRSGDTVAAEAATVETSLVRGAHALEATAASPVRVSIAKREMAFDGLTAQLTLKIPQVSRGPVRGVVKGDLRVATQPEGVHLKLAGRIDESVVKAQVVAAGFAAPVYTFTVDVDRLDLDRYMPAAPARATAQAAPERGESLLAPLAGLPATGTLTVGMLHAGGTKASNVKVVLK
jgi:AsmA protein